MEETKYFLVEYRPDLNEGRYGFQKKGVVIVRAKNYHRKFVEHYCYQKFGNRIDFVMGSYGSHAITETWEIQEIKYPDRYEILTEIEDVLIQ
ncbi:hypothetical protein [Paenibacillus lautus]|uniref:hypothetical protein n=1 Tax=Paenibacillus lautus TaxID=1401 RepID=UPI001C7D47C8|nr:hypothetical protein [Paenibacillus lautus]MBX4152272.1 hypothetical protein [Paenibacillus lautus]